MYISGSEKELWTNSMEVWSITEVWNRTYKGILKTPLENGSWHLGTERLPLNLRQKKKKTSQNMPSDAQIKNLFVS